jgi:TatA/E family protein of Tat protein translocase
MESNGNDVAFLWRVGPSKLPELGRGLGKTAKSFQSAAKEFEKELKEEMKDDDEEAAEKPAKKAE